MRRLGLEVIAMENPEGQVPAVPGGGVDPAAPQRKRPSWVGYVVTAGAIIVLTVVLEATMPVLPIGRYPITYILVVMFAAYIFGEGPALLAFVMAFIAYDYYFVTPEHTLGWRLHGPDNWAKFIAFMTGTVVVAFATLLMRKSKQEVFGLVAKLQDSRAQTIGVLESITDGFLSTDAEDRITYLNPEALRLAQRPHEEVIEENIWDVFPDLSRTKFAQEYRRAVAQRVPAAFDALLPSRNAILDIRIYPSSFGTTIMFHDDTERKKAEEALRESEARSRAVSEMASDAIISCDANGLIVSWNKAAETMFGYTEAEAVGQMDTLIVSEQLRERHLQGLARLKEGGEPRIIAKMVEVPARKRDGSEFPVELSLSTWETKSGRFYTTIIRDITERKKAEDELRTLSQAVQQSPASVVITDINGNIEYVNPKFTRLTGYQPEEVIGRNPRVLKSGEKPPEEYKNLWETITSGREWRGEFHNKKKNGEMYWESASISPITDEKGLITHFLAVKEDMTERKESEEEVRRMSEDLARSNTELQQSARDGSPKMQALIQGLLDYSRVGTLGKDFALTDLGTVLGQAEQNLKVAIEESGAEITHDPLPTVTGDDVQLTELLQNLIANAIKFRKEGEAPRVHVSAERKNGEWVFSVKDNGIGIAQEDVGRLFQVFRRLHPKKEYAGTGIGLAVCKRIVERHGGRMWVESAVGKGSTFYFTIPAVAAAQPAEVEKAA